nr:putative minor capsid protein [Ruminococcus sp. OA3]
MLIHAVTHAIEGEEDRWGNTELVGEQMLTHVRLEPSSKVVRDKSGAEIQLAATLFYDCRNSRPQGITFAVNDIIIFNTQKLRVMLAEPLYDGEKLHHYELGLISYA